MNTVYLYICLISIWLPAAAGIVLGIVLWLSGG